ncbi:MAG: hypothetical protein K5894_16035 [Lachnospiraceae bacterium]|nr:hypothetical protein [Lachnospiraceae bacterium]
MDSVFTAIGDWIKAQIIPLLMNYLSIMFDYVNDEVGGISDKMSITPTDFAPEVFNMIESVSENFIMPIAGIILTFIACYELIQMVMSYNNLANFETWFIFKWIFKTFVAVEIITHTFDITLAVFDLTQYVIQNS